MASSIEAKFLNPHHEGVMCRYPPFLRPLFEISIISSTLEKLPCEIF